MDGWTCPTCHVAVLTPYCPSCGERTFGKHDLTLVGLTEQAIEAVGHLEAQYALLPAAFLAVWLGASGASGSTMDVASVYVLVAISGACLYVAVGAVFGSRGIVRFATVAALAVATALIVIGYRFALLVITLYAT